MPTNRPYKRKRLFNYSVKTRLQLRMFFKVLGVVLVALLVVGTIFYFYSDINVGTSYRLFHVKATNFLDFLFPVLLSGFFVSLFVGAFVALFFPHNFAGPLFRIESELIDIGRGNFSKKLKLRKGSEVNDLADAVNAMVQGLRDNIKMIGDISDQIGNLCEKASAENVDDILEKVKAANTDLQEAVGRFQL